MLVCNIYIDSIGRGFKHAFKCNFCLSNLILRISVKVTKTIKNTEDWGYFFTVILQIFSP